MPLPTARMGLGSRGLHRPDRSRSASRPAKIELLHLRGDEAGRSSRPSVLVSAPHRAGRGESGPASQDRRRPVAPLDAHAARAHDRFHPRRRVAAGRRHRRDHPRRACRPHPVPGCGGPCPAPRPSGHGGVARAVQRRPEGGSMTISVTEQIARLNDRCRQGFDPTARLVVTRACPARLARSEAHTSELIAKAELLAAVRRYDFGPGDGPERDFGAFDLRGERIFFKIDYYDPALEFGSEDPADASLTRRVLTIMLAEDY